MGKWFRHSPRKKLAARLVAFAAWYVLSLSVLIGGGMIAISGHVIPGTITIAAGILLYFWIQKQADKVETGSGRPQYTPATPVKGEIPGNVARMPEKEILAEEKPEPACKNAEPEAPADKSPEPVQDTSKQESSCESDSDGEASIIPKDVQAHKEMLVGKCMEYLIDLIPKHIKPVGFGQKYSISFDFPGTDNLAMIFVESDASDTAQRRIITRVIRKGYDLCVMHYIKKGTLDEIVAYFKEPSNGKELLESLQQLSDNIDDKF